MLKKLAASVMCVVTAVSSLTSCGVTKNTTEENESNVSGEVSAENLNVDVMNFTAPQIGDKIIEMNIRDYGTVKIRLFSEYASQGVENFIGLAEQGYYDGLTFHRVIQDFMIQGGDPLGNGTGGQSVWGSKFDGGVDAHLIHAAGAVAYANSGSTATNGSQFYIVTGTECTDETFAEYEAYGYGFSDKSKEVYKKSGGAPFLDGNYTVFGQVFEGLDIIFRIQNVETDVSDKPLDDVIMESVRVTEYNGEELRWYISDYDYEKPTEPPVENVPLANFTEPEIGEKIVTLSVKDYGDIKIKVFPEYAEKGAENFLSLAEQGYYNGLTFHRVIKDFMIQGGDPNGDGTGGESVWGGEFDGGTDPHLIHVRGAVAYANSGSTATNGSQFYIVTGEDYDDTKIEALINYGYKLSDNAIEMYKENGGTPFLDGGYTVFGQVISGLDIVFKIQNTETDTTSDKPLEDVIIESVTVEEYDGSGVNWTVSAESESSDEGEESVQEEVQDETQTEE